MGALPGCRLPCVLFGCSVGSGSSLGPYASNCHPLRLILTPAPRSLEVAYPLNLPVGRRPETPYGLHYDLDPPQIAR